MTDHRGSEAESDVLTENIIAAAIGVHRQLGPGLLESAYEESLCHELKLRDIPFRRQTPLPIEYKGIHPDCGYRMDIVVEDSLIVELKTVKAILPVHKAQLLTYMKLANLGKGLLLNFYVPVLKQGIKRVVL